MTDAIQRLRDENETLRERVRQLEAVLRPQSISVPAEWGLTVSEQRIYRCLAAREEVSHEALYVALYGDKMIDHMSDPMVTIRTLMHKMRRKIKPFGVHVEVVWGQGYRLRRNKLQVAA